MTNPLTTARVWRTPPVMLPPPIFALWWPFADKTGTPTGGDSFSSGLATNGQLDKSIDKAAVLAGTTTSTTYPAGGGITMSASGAYLDVIPTGDDLATLQSTLDMSTFQENETLMVGVAMDTPSGWATAHTSTHAIFSFGNFASGSACGGVEFGVSSVERPQVLAWAKGSTAQLTALAPDCGFCIDSARNAIVWEIQCVTAGTGFRVRTHLMNSSSGPVSSIWTSEFDWVDAANSGTAAPGCGTFGIRMLRRNGTTTNSAQRSETHFGPWLARLPSSYEGMGKRACQEMYAFPHVLPHAVRQITGDLTVNTGADGNADLTFGDIDESDMFIYLDGATALASHPLLTIEASAPWKNTGSVNPISDSAYYVSDANFEGETRPGGPGGYKFGRVKSGTFTSHFLYSSWKKSSAEQDPGNRARAETRWVGGNVTMSKGVEYWFAGRYYLNFDTDESSVGQILIHQLFPGPTPSDNATYGLFPPFALTLDTTNERIKVEFRTAATTPTLPGDMVETLVYPDAYSTASAFRSLQRRNLDLVVQHKLHWDAAESPFCKIWIDGTLILERHAAYGYRGPKGGTDAKDCDTYFVFGQYPASPYKVPELHDIYVKRAFGCKNAYDYGEPTIRAALTA